MHSVSTPPGPWLAVGMTSLVLGFIGMSLFLLPILGIPICIFGLAFGVVGAVVALFSTATVLRTSLGGIIVAGMGLALNLAIANAPGGYLPQPAVPRPWQAAPDRTYVAPPAYDH